MRGIVTVLNTPFTANDQVALDELRANVTYALNAGVAGFLVPAMAAEVGSLSRPERLAMVDAVMEEVGGRVPVVAGGSAPDRETRLTLARDLLDRGCDILLEAIPYTTPEVYCAAVHELARLDPPCLMLQDWAPDSYGLPVPLICELFAELECFQALKVEVVPAGPKYSELLAATDGRLHVSGGWAVQQLIEALDRGVHAFMPTGLHRTYARIVALYDRGDRAAAQTLFHRLLPILAFSNQHLDISIHFFKRLLHAQGLYSTHQVRSPEVPFDATHAATAAELIRLACDLEGFPAPIDP
jgi:4-hydroxy-tetrahydrodipicolinate synthase